MVKCYTEQLDSIFHELADGTRRGMLLQLAHGPQPVSALAKPYDMSLAAASKHVKKLEQANLVRREIKGRIHLCHLDAAAMAEANAWIKQYEGFWSGRLDVLEHALKADAAARKANKTAKDPNNG